MVVDDTDHMRKMLRSMLEIDGFDVAGEAASGEDAVAAIGAIDPDVVVLDYMMPVMDGVQMLRRLRTMPEHSALPVVLVTAVSEPRVEPKLWNAYLAKPFEIDALLEIVRRFTAPAEA